MGPEAQLTKFLELDRELVRVCSRVKVLSQLAWPPGLKDRFLASWKRGAPELPEPPPVKRRFAEEIERLLPLAEPVADHPVAQFLARTARSYLQAAQMLQNAGTPTFGELSVQLYGHPRDAVAPGGLTNLAAAEHLIQATGELKGDVFLTEDDYSLSPEEVAKTLQTRFDAFFQGDPVQVVIDPELTAKAAASIDRVRIRAETRYSRMDLGQLIHHEGLVHTATLLNGRRQPHLTSLGLGSPRTTCTQEGLATFAELISSAIDLTRLRRISLRIKAIDLALEGADFIDVFRFFHDAGQTPTESFHSAARIFRGGDLRGGVAFTKDAVYLRGLLGTHTFLHAAFVARRVQYTHYLFAGRLTWGDVIELAPFFESGWLAPPRYEPEWLANRHSLAAYLAFSNMTHRLPMHEASLEAFASENR